MREYDVLVCYGNYNLPNIKWPKNGKNYFVHYKNRETKKGIIGDMLAAGLKQVNDHNKSRDKKLDLVFTKETNRLFVRKTNPIVKNEIHHCAISVTINKFVTIE